MLKVSFTIAASAQDVISYLLGKVNDRDIQSLSIEAIPNPVKRVGPSFSALRPPYEIEAAYIGRPTFLRSAMDHMMSDVVKRFGATGKNPLIQSAINDFYIGLSAAIKAHDFDGTKTLSYNVPESSPVRVVYHPSKAIVVHTKDNRQLLWSFRDFQVSKEEFCEWAYVSFPPLSFIGL